MKKYILSTLVIAISLIAFAFSTVTKTTKETHANPLYWYKVTYDASHPAGYIPNSTAFYVQSEKSQVNSPCSAGVDKDCLRGFVSTLTSFPTMASGTDQIKRPN